ncbi:MAG TPA: hypothetical protein VFE59_35205 [Trebonia sp.]|jgi:hypothetical protein|nr:hypothetical protein [Trebonia sp.]
MSLLGATILTAIATLTLAVFAFITAIFALLAWLGQRNEVRDQAKMLQISPVSSRNSGRSTSYRLKTWKSH